MDSNNSSNSDSLSATLSQSGATTSFLLANTLSKPSPQLTRSLDAGSVKTSTTSLPSPAESVSVAKSPSGPSATRSLPFHPICCRRLGRLRFHRCHYRPPGFCRRPRGGVRCRRKPYLYPHRQGGCL